MIQDRTRELLISFSWPPYPWWIGRGKEVFGTFYFSFHSSLPLPVLKMPWIVSEVLPHSQCRYPNSFHRIIISFSFYFQQLYYYEVINIKDRKGYRRVAGCFNLVFITCGINLMISAHCTNAATKPDTLYYVLWRKKPWVTLYWKKSQSNKPEAENTFLASLSMGGESEGQHLT